MANQPKKTLDLDDFIDSDVRVKTNATIDPQDRLLDFARIKVSAIDPQLRLEIDQHLKEIEGNLKRLKLLFK